MTQALQSPLVSLVRYLVLPAHISQFEQEYLGRMNRLALSVLWLHVPVLMFCAALCQTGVLLSLGMSLFCVLGATLSARTLHNPRHVSISFGFCAMCLGGLLVHFGQGPMQIEMHFYFFTVIALLSVFGNPLVILVSAVTVALHHLLLFVFLPRSVFNYDASIWAVVVHALFVVLESVAACFVARSFFNDVIGLELIVHQRTTELNQSNQAMRLVLDHVNQGLVILDRGGTPVGERSLMIEQFLDAPKKGRPFWEWIATHDRHVGQMLALSWEVLIADDLPLELVLDQMPKELSTKGRHLELAYTPIFANGQLQQVLLVVTDVTTRVEKELFEAEQREMVAAIEKMLSNKDAFVDFFGEASVLVHRVTEPDRGPLTDLRRQVHTLKGTSSIFGLTNIAAFCHQIENRLEEGGADVSQSDRTELARRWRRLSSKFEKLLGIGLRRIEISQAEHGELVDHLLRGTPRHQIIRTVASWKLQATESRLNQFADQIRDLAKRLDKGLVEVEIESNDLRISPEHWAGFFGAFSHVVRNAVDHGLETAEERIQEGKSPSGRLLLATVLADGKFIVEISDDGRGIDWERVRHKASMRGLPVETHEQLVDALFRDGVSTKDVVTEISGRGVGLGAARQACQQMGGKVVVTSQVGQGTRFQFVFPAERMVGEEFQAIVAKSVPLRAPGFGTLAPLALAEEEGEAPWLVLSPLVQGACEELFAAYGVNVVHDKGARFVGPVVGATIGFSGEEFTGTLTLCAEPALLVWIGALSPDHNEWIAELSNQLLGRLKTKLLPLGAPIYPSTPVGLSESGASLQGRFRGFVSEAGRAYVWIDGMIAGRLGEVSQEPMERQGALEGPPLPAPMAEGEMLFF